MMGLPKHMVRMANGLDLILSGIRVMVGAASPEEVNQALGNIQRATEKTFFEGGMTHTAQAAVLDDMNRRLSHMEEFAASNNSGYPMPLDRPRLEDPPPLPSLANAYNVALSHGQPSEETDKEDGK